MAWTPPPSYTNGQIITQTDLHVGLRDNMKELWHEVAYVEFVSNVTANVAETTPVDIVSSGAITYAALPTIIEFYACTCIFNGAGGINLWDGSTDLGRMFAVTAAITQVPVFIARRLTPTAASHTYKARLWETSGTATVTAGAGAAGTNMPGYIRVWQRGG